MYILITLQDERQTLLFSATFPEDIQRLAGKFLHNYLFLAVGIVGGACSDVEQHIHLVTKFDKRSKLTDLISQGGWSWSHNLHLDKFHCFTVHFVSLSFIHTNVCTWFLSYTKIT